MGLSSPRAALLGPRALPRGPQSRERRSQTGVSAPRGDLAETSTLLSAQRQVPAYHVARRSGEFPRPSERPNNSGNNSNLINSKNPRRFLGGGTNLPINSRELSSGSEEGKTERLDEAIVAFLQSKELVDCSANSWRGDNDIDVNQAGEPFEAGSPCISLLSSDERAGGQQQARVAELLAWPSARPHSVPVNDGNSSNVTKAWTMASVFFQPPTGVYFIA
ncbi:hypothetical protein WH47_07266 [Habropoda laboriosa]|uniref:Uncharacterized protein n=1 Tax=Habropoda laboriosa TaxID=597456 RepID=A0A0L7R5N2_9HYME|nr:hypothetical protein WH47_07266 [Habropoda laboriosa]